MARFASLPAGLSEDDRKWIETRASWLGSELGQSFITGARIARPDNRAFANNFGDVEDAGSLARQPPRGTSKSEWDDEQVLFVTQVAEEVADHLGLREGTYDVEVLRGERPLNDPPDQQHSSSSRTISVDLAQTPTPLTLIAFLASEFGHLRLGELQDFANADLDLPLLSELLPTLSGLGVCMANATNTRSYLSEEFVASEPHQCLLTMPMFAYSLAVFAYLREEDQPKWERLLRSDIRAAFKESQSYLLDHGIRNKSVANEAFYRDYAEQHFASRSELASYGSRESTDEYEADSATDDEAEPANNAEVVSRNPRHYQQEERLQESGCTRCGKPAFGNDPLCFDCNELMRDGSLPRPQVLEHVDVPDTSSWVMQFILIVLAVTIAVFAVSSMGG